MSKRSDEATYWGVNRKVNRVLSLTERTRLRVVCLYRVPDDVVERLQAVEAGKVLVLIMFF